MTNLGQMMQEAQKMQAKMAEMQKELAAYEASGSSGGGMVEVILNGKGEARRVKINATEFEPGDVEMLEDLMVAAINDARTKVEAHAAKKMAELTSGLQLPPGMQLPF